MEAQKDSPNWYINLLVTKFNYTYKNFKSKNRGKFGNHRTIRRLIKRADGSVLMNLKVYQYDNKYHEMLNVVRDEYNKLVGETNV